MGKKNKEFIIEYTDHSLESGYGLISKFETIKASDSREARSKFFRKYPEGRAWVGIEENE